LNGESPNAGSIAGVSVGQVMVRERRPQGAAQRTRRVLAIPERDPGDIEP
jgi:hypothetical protein